MLTYIIYSVVLFILIFVIVVAFRAIRSGIEYKKNKKENFESQFTNKDTFLDIQEENGNLNLANELNELKKLHSEGIINDDEFKKAKQKILK
tara:strand:- start:1438 stop:1713 length:276 start_codon:yes stop_codon:yes gene_type:complete